MGCGMGYNARRLAQQGARLIVVDLAQRAVQFTRERLLLRDLSAAFLVADAEHLPVAPDAFETVFSTGVIHHSPNTVQAAREIMRVLKAGAATVMVYNRNSRWFWWNIVIVLGALMWLPNSLPARSRERLLVARPAWRDLILQIGRASCRERV